MPAVERYCPLLSSPLLSSPLLSSPLRKDCSLFLNTEKINVSSNQRNVIVSVSPSKDHGRSGWVTCVSACVAAAHIHVHLHFSLLFRGRTPLRMQWIQIWLTLVRVIVLTTPQWLMHLYIGNQKLWKHWSNYLWMKKHSQRLQYNDLLFRLTFEVI